MYIPLFPNPPPRCGTLTVRRHSFGQGTPSLLSTPPNGEDAFWTTGLHSDQSQSITTHAVFSNSSLIYISKKLGINMLEINDFVPERLALPFLHGYYELHIEAYSPRWSQPMCKTLRFTQGWGSSEDKK